MVISTLTHVALGTEEAAERAMTYLDRDPTVKALKEKDLYVTLPYLGKGGIKSWELVCVRLLKVLNKANNR